MKLIKIGEHYFNTNYIMRITFDCLSDGRVYVLFRDNYYEWVKDKKTIAKLKKLVKECKI